MPGTISGFRGNKRQADWHEAGRMKAREIRSAPNSCESRDARTALPQNCSGPTLLPVTRLVNYTFVPCHGTRGVRETLGAPDGIFAAGLWSPWDRRTMLEEENWSMGIAKGLY
jgi:hypothetical protein